MSKIPTAEEFLCEIEDFSIEHCKIEGTIDNRVSKKLIEFAKLHVEAALKAASNQQFRAEDEEEYLEIRNSILNAYPLSNIK